MKKHCNLPASRRQRQELQSPRLWKDDTLESIPTVRYDDVIQGDGFLLRWLEHLQEVGICLVTHAGREEDAVVRGATLDNSARY